MASKRGGKKTTEVMTFLEDYVGRQLKVPAFRKEFLRIADRYVARERNEWREAACALDKAVRPLRDFLHAACGDFTLDVVYGAMGWLLPQTSGIARPMAVEKPVPGRVPRELRRSQLFARLREATARLRPVFTAIRRGERQSKADFRRLIAPALREAGRRMPRAVREWKEFAGGEVPALCQVLDGCIHRFDKRRRRGN